MAEIYSDTELKHLDIHYLDIVKLLDTAVTLAHRASASERVCLNAGMFFEHPDEERKQRLLDSVNQWRVTREN